MKDQLPGCDLTHRCMCSSILATELKEARIRIDELEEAQCGTHEWLPSKPGERCLNCGNRRGVL